MAVHFDEQQGRGLHRQAGVAVILHGADGEVVQKLQGSRDDAGRDDGRHRLRGLVHPIEGGQHGPAGRREGNQLQNDFRDHPQGAFGAHHKPGKVVAGDAFDGAGAGLDRLARSREELQAHDVIQGDPVFQAPEAPGVFRHVAPQGGDRHGAGVRRIKEALGLHRRGQLGGDHPGLHHGVEVGLVDLQDFGQGVGQDHHAAGMGDGAAG